MNGTLRSINLDPYVRKSCIKVVIRNSLLTFEY